MSRVKVGADFFNVQVEGADKKPTLLVCHSLGANLHMWDAQLPALAKHFRVIRYDSRGHGASDATRGPYSIWRLGRDALAILDALGVAQAHFLGLSMGGMVGLWLLANARERIGRAVLASTAAAMPPPDAWNNRIRMARENGMGAIAQMIVDLWFPKPYQDRAPEQVGRVRAMLAETPAHGYAAACAAIRDMDQRETVRSIANPVLLLAGSHDQAIPPESSRYLATAIPGAKLQMLDAGHLSNVEAEAAFTAAVVSFLRNEVESAPKTSRAKPAPAAPAKSARRAKSAAKKRPAAKPPRKAAKKKPAARKAPRKPLRKAAGKKTKRSKTKRKSA
jgi:3-oxoadipate enol-lactonase